MLYQIWKRKVQPKTSITTAQIYAHMLPVYKTSRDKMLTNFC